MRAYKRTNNRGFTLVELMIVVAIIGVLAALAIYGVRKYLASAKTSEAKNTVGSIARMASAAYERETVASELVAEGTSGQGASHVFCLSAGPVPAAPPPGNKYQPSSAANTDFENGDSLNGWKCLRFTINQPIYYQYLYAQGAAVAGSTNPDASGADFEAAAHGDLSADGAAPFSEFSRAGSANVDAQTVRLQTQIYVANEFD